jgi:hypothetical protein
MKNKGTNAEEPMAMTYGMSDYLVNSGLLTQISSLSTKDKQCLLGYIAQEVADSEAEEDDVDWDLMDKDLPPYTLDELHARIEESHASYLRGDYVTAEESNTLLKEKYLWLQYMDQTGIKPTTVTL